jgi:hypothetical protein
VTRASLAPRLLSALGAGAIVAAAAYSGLRLLDAALFPQANPASIVWSAQSAFAFRVAVAAHLGALGAFGAFALATSAPRTLARWLRAAIPLVAAFVALQAVLRP